MILSSTYDFVLGMVEEKYLVSFIGSFDGARGDVGGPCVGPRRIYMMTDSNISMIYLKDYYPVYCRT